MKIFSCQSCGNVLYFENRSCGRCGHKLGYDPDRDTLVALKSDRPGFRTVERSGRRFFCSNASQDACNWLLLEGQDDGFCLACRHNGTVPDLSIPSNLIGWRELEAAKHSLFYSLLRWRLPLRTRAEDSRHGLVFNFLADTPAAKVMTGHENGVVTIALAEADEIERERRRVEMGEPYRTLLGHFRHEVGHHYWDLLVRDGGELAGCRLLFGDETLDYQAALERHYRQGPPSDWRDRFVSGYASVHPWEDFAETWAHYLHIIDTLEMAGNFGIRVAPAVGASEGMAARIDFDPYAIIDFDRVVASWLPFVFAMNSVNRAIGSKDLYPFVLAPPVIEKLRFVHRLVRRRKGDPVAEGYAA
ncbi:putative zinc-binding metallopeptidase [Bradyrhizobium jicamae]|uniref:zinc-binding metallopeptidase family protein n=1 Tax=Bradyrhizobium jicamae TaxID=280332 RepID=UPI001BABA447|nr:putative zinc-binding peptidase [Bradyrhizobium jicamae]MBR0933419.1 putative zinc-binding peptidase [Bradyrhizobium jicamae]